MHDRDVTYFRRLCLEATPCLEQLSDELRGTIHIYTAGSKTIDQTTLEQWHRQLEEFGLQLTYEKLSSLAFFLVLLYHNSSCYMQYRY